MNPKETATGNPSPHLDYLLSAYLLGEISDVGRNEVERHLAACAECRDELESLKGTLAAARAAVTSNPKEPLSLAPERFRAILAARRRRACSDAWRRALLRRRPRLLVAASAVLVLVILVGLSVPAVFRGRSYVVSPRFRTQMEERLSYYSESDGEPAQSFAPSGALKATPPPGRKPGAEGRPQEEFQLRIEAGPREAGQTWDFNDGSPARDISSLAVALRDKKPKVGVGLASPGVRAMPTGQSDSGLREREVSDLSGGDKLTGGGSANGLLVGGDRVRLNDRASPEPAPGSTAPASDEEEPKFTLFSVDSDGVISPERAGIVYQSLPVGPGMSGAPISGSGALDPGKEQTLRLGDLERRLRAFAHYRALDNSLTLDAFAARDLRIPPPSLGNEGLSAEEFRRRYGVHPFVETRFDRFSTFGMDVDTASWNLAVANLRSGRLPPPKSVRVEEFINSFGEDIPVDPEEVFTFAAEGGPSPFGEGLDLLKIVVKARELREGERKDAVLTFLIDASGSMAAALSSGTGRPSRLETVQEALVALVQSLSPEDRVQIVAYATTPYLVLPLTPAREASRIIGAVKSIEPSGATNLEAGLDLAYRVADEAFNPRAVNRVILCSDGVANLGARNPEEILKRVEVFARRGIYLSTVGFGLGKYDDAMLETLADRGNGNYSHVDSPERAKEIFRQNLPGTLHVLAVDAKIQVEFNPEVVTHYRLLGYENRDIRDEDFRNDKVDAGEVGPGSTVTALYEIRRRPASAGDLGKIFVRYRDAGTGKIEERNYPLSPGVMATALEETTDRFRFTAALAELAELLRGSYWARDGSYAKVLEILEGLSPEFRASQAWRDVADAALRAQAITVRALAGQ